MNLSKGVPRITRGIKGIGRMLSNDQCQFEAMDNNLTQQLNKLDYTG
jgi:hypothetical protein